MSSRARSLPSPGVCSSSKMLMVKEVVPLGTVTLPEINCQSQGTAPDVFTIVGGMLSLGLIPIPLNVTSIFGITSKQHWGMFLTFTQNLYSPAATATVCDQMDLLPVWPVRPLTTMNLPALASQVEWSRTDQFGQICSAPVPLTMLYSPGSVPPGPYELLAAYWLVMPGQTGGSSWPMGLASNSPFVKRFSPGQHHLHESPATTVGNPYWLKDTPANGNTLAGVVIEVHPPITKFGVGKTNNSG